MQRIVMIVAGLAGLGTLIAGVLLLSDTPVRSAQSAPSIPTPPKTGNVQVGDRVIVGTLEDDNPERWICMVREIKDRDEVQRLVATRDTEGMRQALGHLRATLVPNRSAAVLLQLGSDLCRVRILEGAVRGREGWLPSDCLLREQPR